jgi:RND family efflux transporter MFP subunit
VVLTLLTLLTFLPCLTSDTSEPKFASKNHRLSLSRFGAYLADGLRSGKRQGLIPLMRLSNMLKITFSETSTEERWILHGRLAVRWVQELRACWKKKHRTDIARACIVELNEVTFIDKSGERLLSMMAKDGAQFSANGIYTKRILEHLGIRRKGGISLCCLIVLVFVAIVAAGCERGVAAAPAPPPPMVEVAPVIRKDVPLESEWVGTTVGFVDAQIRPHVQGYLMKQDYQDGLFVKEGQLLFELDDRDYKAALDQALGALAQQEAHLKKNQLDLARYRPLAAQGAVSRQDLDDTDQATRASQAQVESARAAVETAKLNLGWTRILAPIDGIAEIAPVQVGDLVTPSTLLTTVSQVDPIKVNFPISEQEYLRHAEEIKQHQETGRAKAEPQLELILGDGSLYKYPGHFYRVDRSVDIQTGTIEVQGVFPNPEAILRPGQYARIQASTGMITGALLVPQPAVSRQQGTYQITVIGSDNRAQLRTVEVGPKVGTLWVIASGLKPGERVVTVGAEKTREGQPVNPTPYKETKER